MENLMLSFMQENWLPEKVLKYTDMLDALYGMLPQKIETLDMYFMSVPEDRTVGEMTDDIEDLMRDILKDLLAQLGVFLSDDAQVLDAYAILEQILLIEDNENIDYIIAVLEDPSETPEDKFYAVLNTAGGLLMDEATYLDTIVKVLPESAQKLLEHMRSEASTLRPIVDLKEQVFIRGTFEKLKHFIEKVNDRNFFMIERVTEGMALGIPFEVMFQHYGADVLNLDSKEAIYNLYLMALMSTDGQNDPAGFLARNIGVYLPDLARVDLITRTVRDMQIKLSLN